MAWCQDCRKHSEPSVQLGLLRLDPAGPAGLTAGSHPAADSPGVGHTAGSEADCTAGLAITRLALRVLRIRSALWLIVHRDLLNTSVKLDFDSTSCPGQLCTRWGVFPALPFQYNDATNPRTKGAPSQNNSGKERLVAAADCSAS